MCVCVFGMSLSLLGRVYIIQDWQDWTQWPSITWVMDLGSDNNSGVHAGLYKFEINGMQWSDGSHGGTRDFSLSLSLSLSLLLDILKLKHFWVLMMVSWNLPHGSDVHRDGKWYQLKAANTHYYETQSPKTALLFQEHVSDMHEELVRQGVQFPGEEDRDVEVWNYLKATQPLRRMIAGVASLAS